MDFSLVLASQGINHRIECDGEEFSLSLDDVDAPLVFLAVPVFGYFEVETRPWANW